MGPSSSKGNVAEIRTVGLKEFLCQREDNPDYVSGNDWQFCVLHLALLYVHIAYVEYTVKRNLCLVLGTWFGHKKGHCFCK